MLPDLGKYAVEVLSAYAVSMGLLLGLILLTLRRGRRARAALREVEAEVQKNG